MLSVYFTVITRSYNALSKHAHSCSGIKLENLADAEDFEGTFSLLA